MKFSTSYIVLATTIAASTTSAVKLRSDIGKNGNEMHQISSRHLEGDDSKADDRDRDRTDRDRYRGDRVSYRDRDSNWDRNCNRDRDRESNRDRHRRRHREGERDSYGDREDRESRVPKGDKSIEPSGLPTLQPSKVPSVGPTLSARPSNKSIEVKYVTVVDTISGSKSITCGDIITGTTVCEAPGSFPTCGTSNSNAPAVYFKLEGASGNTEINLCNSNYDTKVSVFRDVRECGGILVNECVGGNDDACGDDGIGSSFTIPDANPNDVYYVIVHGYLADRYPDSGNYKLAVNCGTALPDTMDASPEMAQMMKEREEMMHEMQTEDCEESERVCPASAGK